MNGSGVCFVFGKEDGEGVEWLGGVFLDSGELVCLYLHHRNKLRQRMLGLSAPHHN